MVSFESDYTTGAHPLILKRLAEINLEPLSGYGTDAYCESAREKIKKACGCMDGDVEFFVGGTQANAVVTAAVLKDHEGVVAAETGHISTHEAGAVEAGGHKVLEIAQENGKIKPAVLKKYLDDFYADENKEHMVFPGMVYLSHPTEYGTIYTKAELAEISGICRSFHIPLFLDGARLGYGLTSGSSDMTLLDIARFCDIFTIGGTKAGALCGEAAVFTKNNKPAHFMTSMKRRGALLAKGWLLGVQFDTLFSDGLYFELARHAVTMAEGLKDIFKAEGIPFYLESPTNQQFVILENEKMEALKEHVKFSFWEKYDEDHTVVRFAAGWSTTDEELAALTQALRHI